MAGTPQRVPGYQNAVGYWGNDPHCRLEDDQTAAKIRALLQDELRLNGSPVSLWQPVLSTTAGAVACTCRKDTTANSDYKCLTCYGTQYAPGYLKFLNETLFYCSAEAALFTLTNAVVDTTKKPNRIRIADGQTTGVIVTTDKAFSNPRALDWTVELAAYRKIAGDTITLEYSTDAGVTWTAVALTLSPTLTLRGTMTGLPRPIGAGNLRYRITLTRLSGTSVESPSFEIVRARHTQDERANPILSSRSDLGIDQILILKTWITESVARDIARGRIIEHEGDRMRTAPLDFFDLTLTRDTPACALDDRGAGPHPFFEYANGIRLGQRYAIVRSSFDTTIDNFFTQQSFSERRTQSGELYDLVM